MKEVIIKPGLYFFTVKAKNGVSYTIESGVYRLVFGKYIFHAKGGLHIPKIHITTPITIHKFNWIKLRFESYPIIYEDIFHNLQESLTDGINIKGEVSK